MKKTATAAEKRVKELTSQVKKLKAEHAKVKEIEDSLVVKIQKSQARFERVKNPNGYDHGIGRYLLVLAIKANKTDVYIPISIASGKKTTGFMYQIEGTGKGSLVGTDISCRGEGTSQITLGTIVYAKIPTGKKAEFRIQFEIKGKIGKTYKAVINRINYKLEPSDARYKQYAKAVSTDTLQFN
jgi:hypothetical protein